VPSARADIDKEALSLDSIDKVYEAMERGIPGILIRAPLVEGREFGPFTHQASVFLFIYYLLPSKWRRKDCCQEDARGIDRATMKTINLRTILQLIILNEGDQRVCITLQKKKRNPYPEKKRVLNFTRIFNRTAGFG